MGQTNWALMLMHVIFNKILLDQHYLTIYNIESHVDRELHELLFDRVVPAATTLHFPFPHLYLAARQSDLRKGILVAVFDFAGEILLHRLADMHEVKEIHMGMDGYFLFLDPRSLCDARWSQYQLENVQRFLADLRQVHGTRQGQKLRVPIAVCISKLDILPAVDPARATEHLRFIQAIQDAGPTGEAATPEVVARRSALCLDHLPHLFPDNSAFARLNPSLYDVCYFPMSSYGFREIGETDLRKRHFDPFGVTEPLVWLIQRATGY